MTVDEHEDLFALLDHALEELGVQTQQRSVEVRVTKPDGTVHVCCGAGCREVELNSDKHYVCKWSGIVSSALRVREDYSTGRQAGSANPDDHAGEPLGGAWKPKKDLAALSQIAFRQAGGEQENQEIYVSPLQKKLKPSVKRGARCVDDVAPEDPKRHKPARRQGEHTAALCTEAESTVRKLVNFEKRPESKSKRDPRLQDESMVFAAAVKRYAKECLNTNTVPTLDAVHNLALAAANVAAAERQRASVQEGNRALLLKVRMREKIPALAVALWTAAQKTPYFQKSRRGADAFRPFVSGVLYALKRGVWLPDGTQVVPCAPELAAALPALRATAVNSVAKAIHASSHRGLCTLHRSAASCVGEDTRLFADAAHLCRQLVNDVAQKRFDIV